MRYPDSKTNVERFACSKEEESSVRNACSVSTPNLHPIYTQSMGILLCSCQTFHPMGLEIENRNDTDHRVIER